MSIIGMTNDALHRNYPDLFKPAATEAMVGAADNQFNRDYPVRHAFGTAPKTSGDQVAKFDLNMTFRDAGQVRTGMEQIAKQHGIGVELLSNAYSPDSLMYKAEAWGAQANLKQAMDGFQKLLESLR